jgi:penicillin-binding protein 1A
VATRGQTVRGASTITQQVMKNFLLGGDRTGERKIKEIILATRIEETLSKDEILELYLNEIFLGQNSYGVAAAAQTYFNKTAGRAGGFTRRPSGRAAAGAVELSPGARPTGCWRGATMCCAGCGERLYRPATLEHERAQPLRTVQGGDFPPSARPAAARLFHRRDPPPAVGHLRRGGILRRRADHPRHGGPRPAAGGRARLRDGLEKYDRGLGVWRGTGEAVAAEALGRGRLARGAGRSARCRAMSNGWFPAVVLEVGGNTARIGIEGVDEGETDHEIPPRM